MKIMARRKVVLDGAAKAVLRDRQREHGAPENTFETHAQLWSVYLSQKSGKAINLTPGDVAAMMILFKVGRMMANSGNGDNWIDIAGYAACGSEVAAAMVDVTQEEAAAALQEQANAAVMKNPERIQVAPVVGRGSEPLTFVGDDLRARFGINGSCDAAK